MTNRPITAADAEALLRGTASSGQGDLESLVSLVARVRSQAGAGEVAPSAALEAWFEAPVVHGESDASAPAASRPVRRRLALVPGWIAGLGLVAKIALGSTVAAASVIGAGAAAVLPPAAQGVFDEVLSNVASLDMQQLRGEWNGPADDAADETPVTDSDTPPVTADTPVSETPAVGRDGNPGKGTPPENAGNGTPPQAPGNGTPPESPGNGTPGTPANPATPPTNPGKGTPPANPGAGTPPANPGAGTPPANPGNGTPPANPGAGTPATPGKGTPPANPSNGKPAAPGKPSTPATPQTPGNAGEAGSPVAPPGKGRP